MKHRLISSIALAALACAVVVAGAAGGGKGRLYQFRGELLSTGPNSVQLKVEGGNHAALKALIGQARTRVSRPAPGRSFSAGRRAFPTSSRSPT